MVKDLEKVEQEIVHVASDIVFIIGNGSVGKARGGGLFDIQEFGNGSPSVGIVLQRAIFVFKLDGTGWEFGNSDGSSTKKVARVAARSVQATFLGTPTGPVPKKLPVPIELQPGPPDK